MAICHDGCAGALTSGLLSQWISLDPKHPCPAAHTRRRVSELERGPSLLSTSGYKEVQSLASTGPARVGRDHHNIHSYYKKKKSHPSARSFPDISIHPLITPHHVCSGLLP
ncbi:hypothetical protein FJTKL_02587 [Diaporthe vaccinii]|uniref:Uncharacterized protein n=1 Tax=Diaporthe vaccinii TaxID=105482 RepID=A0ABR4DXU5_9PEZI